MTGPHLITHADVVARAIADGCISVIFAAVVVYCLWPWDWRGRRRSITVKRDRRPFE